MKKSLLFFSCLGLLGMAITLPGLSTPTMKEGEAQFTGYVAPTNVATDWAVVNGDSKTLSATDITGGVKIGNLHAYSAAMTMTSSPVNVDGLSFEIWLNNRTAGWNNAVGVSLTDKTTYGMVSPMISIWRHPYTAEQTRVHIGADHDYNTQTIAHPEMSDPLLSNPASSVVCNVVDNIGFKITYTKENGSWWKVKLASLVDGTLWTNNTNYDDSDKSVYYYIKDSDMVGVNDGKAYLEVIGLGDGGEAEIKNFVNGKTPTVQTLEQAIKDAKIELQTLVEGLKTPLYSDANLALIKAAHDKATSDLNLCKSIEEVKETLTKAVAIIKGYPMFERSDKWVAAAGEADRQTAYKIDNKSVIITNHYGYGAFSTKNDEKVIVDGLRFTYKQISPTPSDIGGWYLTSGLTTDLFADSTCTFTMWPKKEGGGTQDRLVCAQDHNPAHTPLCYTDKELTTAGFGIASSLVLNAHENPGVTVEYKKVSKTVYSVTFGEIYADTIWNSNANYDATKHTSTVFVKASDLGIDDNGEAYLNVYGWSGSYSYISNLENGEHKAEKGDIDEYKAKINAIDETQYLPQMKAYIEKEKEAAIAQLKEEQTDAEMRVIFDELIEHIHAEFKGLVDYGENGLRTIDPTANVTYRYPGCSLYGTRRFDDDGASMVTMKDSYGNGIRLVKKYDVLNFKLSINLREVPVSDAVNVVFSENNSAINEENYFHFEFLKTAENKYLAILGNGVTHNVSDIDGWKRDTSGAYTGRWINTQFDTIVIIIGTDAANGKTKITVNDEEITLDTDALVNNCDPKPTESLLAGVVVGAMNSKSVREDQGIDFIIMEAIDKNSEDYNGRLAQLVEAEKANVDAKKGQLLGLLTDGKVTDDNVKTYREMIDKAIQEISNPTQLEPYDFAKYVKEHADKAIEEMRSPLDKYNEAVEQAKQEIVEMLKGYREENYSEENAAKLKAIIEAAPSRIEELDILGKVQELKETIKGELDAIKTKAQEAFEKELSEKKENAKSELQAYANIAAIEDTTLMQAVAKLVSDGKAEIDLCSTIEAVTAKLVEIKGRIDAKKAEFEAAKALAAAKEEYTAKVDEFEKTIDLTKYSEDNQKVIHDAYNAAKAEIEAATTIETVKAAYDSMVQKVNAVEVKKGGCGGSVIAASAIIAGLSLAGAALLIKRRKED